MERTGEFTRITQLFSDAPIIMAKHRPLSKYARVSQQISDAISQTESLLKELSNLAMKKHITVEDDPTKQISDIVDIVKKSIPPTLQDIETFEKAVTGDNQMQKHFYIVCSSLKTRMSNCGKALQDGMQTRASVVKKQSERRTKFSFTGQSPSVQLAAPLNFRNNPSTPQSNHAVDVSNNGGTPAMDNTAAQNSAGMRRRPLMSASSASYAQQQQQQNFVRHRTAQSRLNDAQNMEAMIGEIGGMYSRMTGLIASQGEVLGRIEDDMTIAHANVEGGYFESLAHSQDLPGLGSLHLPLLSPIENQMMLLALGVVAAVASALPLNGWYNCSYNTFGNGRRLQSTTPRTGFHRFLEEWSNKATSSSSSSGVNPPPAQCGTFTAPFCHAGVCTSQKSIEVFVKRILASGGTTAPSLWLLQGGPGSSSTAMESLMTDWYNKLGGLVSVYTMDHRGTGRSEYLMCEGTQSQTDGSSGGSSITLEELPQCLQELQFLYDGQAAGFSITSAAKDLAAIIDSLPETEVYIYGVSYGTALVERLMHFSPTKVRGFVLDSVQSEDYSSWENSPTFSNWDRDFNVIAIRFLDLCNADKYCSSKFMGGDVVAELTRLYAAVDAGTSNCTTFIQNTFGGTTDAMRMYLGSLFPSMYLRLFIPIMIHRLSRCSTDDLNVLKFLFSRGGGGSYIPDSTADSPDSDLLYKTIVYSELWQRPTLSYGDLYTYFSNTLMSSGMYSMLPEYCVYVGAIASEPGCIELASIFPSDASPSTKFVYTPDMYYNVTAQVPSHASVVVLSGKLDPQTPNQYAEKQYELMVGSKRLFSFDYAAHATILTTPVMDPYSPTCAVSLIISYVQNRGDLAKIDTTCTSKVLPLTFELSLEASKYYFNVTEPFDGIIGQDLPTPSPTTPPVVDTVTSSSVASSFDYSTGLIVVSALLGAMTVIVIGLIILVRKYKPLRQVQLEMKA